jgi:Putative beta-barrel porin-2, OmpL-like. bbp2
MKYNKWTLGLAAVGVVSLASAVQAEETTQPATLLTAVSSTTLSGYVDVSVQGDFGAQDGGFKPAPNYNIETATTSKKNAFNLNVVDVALDKPMSEDQWAAGYHVELWFGQDANALGTAIDGEGNAVPAAIRQAYISLRTPVGGSEIDWKLGVFDTIIGYEGLSSPSNPNYSHSYGYNLEPFSHTGILGTYKITDWVSVSAGIANQSYSGGYISAAQGQAFYNPTLLGDVVFTAPDSWGWMKGASLTAGIVNTSSSLGLGARSWYAGLTAPTPWDKLKWGAAFDYLDQQSNEAVGVDGSIWAAGLYTSYQATEKLSLNVRGEYTDNHAQALGTFPNGIAGKGEEITLDAQYDLWKNVLTRLEVRWDHSDTPAGSGFATSSGSPRTSAYMIALQAIYKF